MEFELTPLLTDDIIFAMENQMSDSVLDTEAAVIINMGDTERMAKLGFTPEEMAGNDRFIDLPHWTSQDGFRLMDRFVSELRNPIVRDRLQAALASGRGVFRAFKNVLKESPEVEKLWYAYKDHQMKETVTAWYNDLRESWGLARVGPEPEETEELVVSDFLFRAAGPEDRERITALRKALFLRLHEDLPQGIAELMYRQFEHAGREDCLVVETPEAEFAGFLSSIREAIPDGASLVTVTGFGVKEEYRGLGIGEALLDRFLDGLKDEYAYVGIEVPDSSPSFAPVLVRKGFVARATSYLKKPS